MKLRNKINLYTSVLFIVLLILMNASIYFLFSHLMTTNELNRAEANVEKIVSDIGKTMDRISPDQLLLAYVPVNGMIRVLNNDLTINKKITTPSEGEAALKSRPTRFVAGATSEVITLENKRYTFVSYPVVWNDGSVANLQVTSSIQATDDMINILRILLIVVTITAMIPAFLSSRVLSNLIILPIRSMIDTMKDIQKSAQFKRLELEKTSESELVEMGETFNHMIDILQTNFEKQEQFVSNASHELRTPLTIIENYADLLKRRGLERPDLFEESIEAIHSEAVRMRELTEQLLQLARQQEQWNIQLEQINVTELVTNTANTFQNTYQRKVLVEGNEITNGYTDPQKLKQLLYIFLDNARKYSEDQITIHVGQASDETYIQIEDKGMGIPKHDLPHVFDRFYRVDQARSRKQSGSGLGLTMAKQIADAIGIRMELNSLENRGTTIILFFKQTEIS
ncbi:cell wall metabolism sensor histidine kinase WalK [Psychrobacillus sp. OK032]|uniref:sensor histidine kinase n=1 Tax=Psychrobacillus sp. OK032 TaxID=1884358 RepID=UPI0008D0D22F|nr:HAMP domain-containing sensor histidine kinase [Psychrobacillus sp. OK032]SES26421.1 Signal transduction histidine kinase [Psychrobacillus sp. OK032]